MTKGVEAESTILVGGGLAVYLNGTKGSAKYAGSNLWVQNAPRDTETLGLTYNLGSWNVGFFNKRVGQMYNDNGSAHQAVPIDPFNITNLFVNYTLRGSSKFSQTRIRLAVNNLTNSHAITAVTPASAKSNAPAARRHADADGGAQRRRLAHGRLLALRKPALIAVLLFFLFFVGAALPGGAPGFLSFSFPLGRPLRPPAPPALFLLLFVGGALLVPRPRVPRPSSRGGGGGWCLCSPLTHTTASRARRSAVIRTWMRPS